MYQERPSNILGIDDEYTSFCFDEACAYIMSKIDDGKKPKFDGQQETNQTVNRKARLPSEIYKHYEENFETNSFIRDKVEELAKNYHTFFF